MSPHFEIHFKNQDPITVENSGHAHGDEKDQAHDEAKKLGWAKAYAVLQGGELIEVADAEGEVCVTHTRRFRSPRRANRRLTLP